MEYPPFYSIDGTHTVNWDNVQVEDLRRAADAGWDLRVKIDAVTFRMSYSQALSLAHSLRVACGAAEEGEAKGGTDD